MKALKVNHSLAQLILKGQSSVTWRLYDDKDLSVNDFVQIIDKLDPERPATWKVIGIAQITKIVEKPLGDTEPSEYELSNLSTQAQVLKTYRRYYGSNVSSSTPVKIVHFSFTPEEVGEVNSVTKNTTLLQEIKLYADGGSRGNPGPSACGFVIMDMDDQIVVKRGVYLGVTTNNQAEYQALKLGLEEALKMRAKKVHVFLDSLLVVNQMLGIFKVKNRDLWPIHGAIKELSTKFEKVVFTHVPRELNKLADRAVNETLDKALK
jgi:ribonuclease HI